MYTGENMKKGMIVFLEISCGILLILMIILGLRYVNKNNFVNKINISKNFNKQINKDISKEAKETLNEKQDLYESRPEIQKNKNISDTEISDTKNNKDNKDNKDELKEAESEDETIYKNVKMAFTGDILFTDYLLSQYDLSGISSIVADDLLDYMKESDICMANEEFPFSNKGTKAKDKQFTFRIDPLRVKLFSDMGIDIVTLANNHSLDYGEEALTDTIQTLKNEGIDYSGAGNDLTEARQLRKYTINGKNIGILSASRVIPVAEWAAGSSKAGLNTTYDPTNLVSDIQSADEECDLVAVYVHWGVEKAEYPQDYQRSLAKQYIDAGADMVIGSHPHVLQGIEYYNNKPIVYSLGNYIFGKEIPKTVLLMVEINEDNSLKLRLIPCTTDASLRLKIAEEKKSEIYNYIESISYGITIDEDGIVG